MRQHEIRVIVVDDHQLVLDGITARLERIDNVKICAALNNGQDAIQACIDYQADLIFLDIGLPNFSGIDTALAIKRQTPQVKIIVITGTTNEIEMLKMLEAGASACLSKGDNFDFKTLIDMVWAGYVILPHMLLENFFSNAALLSDKNTLESHEIFTQQEKLVLQELVNGATNKEIAQVLGISVSTVKVHLGNIFQKLNVQTRTEAVILVTNNNLLNLKEE